MGPFGPDILPRFNLDRDGTIFIGSFCAYLYDVTLRKINFFKDNSRLVIPVHNLNSNSIEEVSLGDV